ncbi:HpcH/HpaI aldolase/citrate lyase family protein [Paenibacillus xylaniclasticus]|uniref:HpcH/HpaI aldolase/citrate lyase family protein n=1 Tax=Paenibacillus xylaniclasticus TaxID=588083 RepID=UPI000FDA3F07|nr:MULTISPECIES: HpcH/HpaI aldolase/citrate lyase family protein [Paenibacillus]GFN31540.1 ATP/GTP-binding protein [Paenibacillus curdlanolyticus]
MRYFAELSEEEERTLFHSPPVSFTNRSPKEVLAYALGAALYMPATRATIASEVIAGKLQGLITAIIDLEDAIGDLQVETAEAAVVQHMARIAMALESGVLTHDRLPLLFVRVRSVEQMQRLLEQIHDSAHVLTGFVFPKFTPENGGLYFELLDGFNRGRQKREPLLYGMPVLESAPIIYRETRHQMLLGTKRLLDRYRPYVLNVRIGATDFSSLFGLRRSPELTVYDIAAIRDCIADIVNVFGRAEDGYVISGPVWEYFESGYDRAALVPLREAMLRDTLLPELGLPHSVYRTEDGHSAFMREIWLDKENGMIGKTIIHPSQLRPVQAMYTVTHEEYADACAILANSGGGVGVMKSEYANKMNEMKPHYHWATKMVTRAKIYGVLNVQQRYTALFREHGYARL